MARVTIAEVKEILDTRAGDPTITAAIAAATLLIDHQLLDVGYTDAHLKEIERWLAAHFVCIFDPRKHAQAVGDSTTTYEGKTDQGLNATLYGQQAVALDTSRILAGLSTVEAPTQQSTFEVFGG